MKNRANKGRSALDKGEMERSQHKRKGGKLTREKGKKNWIEKERERREKQKGIFSRRFEGWSSTV